MLAMAALLAVEHEEMVERRREQFMMKKFLRDTSDPFNIGDNQFHHLYRMYPWIAIELIDLLLPHLPSHPSGIPPHLQVLSVLRFMAEGSYQKGVAQEHNHPISQSTFSKYLHIVVPAINEFAPEFISFPRNREERQVIQGRFQQRIGFRGVLGAIDCTLPKIHTPSEHEEVFVNYQQDHSFNIQVVSDMDYNIMDIRICNGSSNDRFIWNWSDIRARMYTLRNDQEIMEQEGPYYLIGDGGYTPSTVLLTPIADAAPDSPQFRYPDRLRRTRCRIEQRFGIWKEIFRCINGDRSLHYEPLFGAQIVLASAVLYNFLRHHGMPMPVPPPIQNHPIIDNYFYELEDEYLRGLEVRDAIIAQNFQ